MKKYLSLLILLLFIACGKETETNLSNTLGTDNITKNIVETQEFQLFLTGADFDVNGYTPPLNQEQEYLVSVPYGENTIKAWYYLQLGKVEVRFDRWSDGSRENPRTIFVDGDTSLRAIPKYFSPVVFVTKGSLYDGYFEIEGSNYVPGEVMLELHKKVEVTAKAPAAHVFVEWEDGVTTATRTIIPDEYNGSYQVYYALFEWRDQWKADRLYEKNELAINNDLFFMSKWITIGEEPDPNNPHGAWEQLNPYNNPDWNKTTEYQRGDVVRYNGKNYAAKWWTRGDVPSNDEYGPWLVI